MQERLIAEIAADSHNSSPCAATVWTPQSNGLLLRAGTSLNRVQAPAGQAQAVRKAKAPVGLGVLSARKKAKGGKLQKGASNLIGKWQAVQQVRRARLL